MKGGTFGQRQALALLAFQFSDDDLTYFFAKRVSNIYSSI